MKAFRQCYGGQFLDAVWVFRARFHRASSALGAGDTALVREFLYLGIFVPPGEDSPPRSIVNEPDLVRYWQGWGRMGDEGWVAVLNSIPAGAVWLRLWSSEDRGYGWVADAVPELSIAVLAELRGQGLGTRLLTSLFDGVRSPVSLSVQDANPAARLYRRFGFETVREEAETLTMIKPGAI